uniref:Uncharacterized protein n=1 Tax=Panagrolaimus superbus TaxID=310955 RepID=A0A914Y730_9BILA
MAQTYLFITFLAALLYLCHGDNTENITTADTIKYYYKQNENENQKWHFNFASDLRGFIIFNQNFELNKGETVLVYQKDGSLAKYFLANYTSTSTKLNSTNFQRLTAEKGEGLTVVYNFVSPTPTTPTTTIQTSTVSQSSTSTASTTSLASTSTAPTTSLASTVTGPTTMPPIFMFLVSSYNETASLMNNTQDSGIWDTTNVTNTIVQTIQTHGNVTQIWHYYPASQDRRLSFALIDSTALKNNVGATLTLYRGDANDLSNTSTIIHTFNDTNSLDNIYTYGGKSYMYGGNYGEPLSLYYDYPYVNETFDDLREYGFNFMVGVLLLNESDPAPPVTDVNGNTVTTLPPITDANGSTKPPVPTVIVTDTNGNTVTDSSKHAVTETLPMTVPTIPTVSTTPTIPMTTTSTASSMSSFFFVSLAPIIITFMFHMCQA